MSNDNLTGWTRPGEVAELPDHVTHGRDEEADAPTASSPDGAVPTAPIELAAPIPGVHAGGRVPQAVPPVARASRFGRFFAQLGGMRSDLIDDFPSERRDYIQMAFILFTTGIMATISAAFAIYMAFSTPELGAGDTVIGMTGPPWYVLAIAGVMWGFIIFNIDRYMVLGMEGLHRTSVILPFLLRGGLAVLIGLVLSTPLVLQIFSSEIDDEISIIHLESYNATQAQVQVLRDAYADMQAKVASAQRMRESAHGQPNIEDNPSFKAAEDAYQQALTDCTAAQKDATLEMRGKLPPPEGSGKPGASGVYRTFQKKADQICSTVQSKLDTVNAIKDAAVLSPGEVQANVDRADETWRQLTDQLNSLSDQLSHAQGEISGKTGGWGLLVRLQALERLTSPRSQPTSATPSTQESQGPATPPGTASPQGSASPDPSAVGATAPAVAQLTSGATNDMAGWAHRALIALLASIEILPVLFKAIKQWNPQPTAYEVRWRDIDNDLLARTRLVQRREFAALQQSSYGEVFDEALSRQQREAVGRQIVNDVTGVQLQFMRNELQRWADEHNVDYRAGSYSGLVDSGDSDEDESRRTPRPRDPVHETGRPAEETPTQDDAGPADDWK